MASSNLTHFRAGPTSLSAVTRKSLVFEIVSICLTASSCKCKCCRYFRPDSTWVFHYVSDDDHNIKLIDEFNPTVGIVESTVVVDNGNLTCVFTRDNTQNPLAINLGHSYWLTAYGSGEQSSTFQLILRFFVVVFWQLAI